MTTTPARAATRFHLTEDPGTEVIDERFRQLGARLAGWTLGEVAAQAHSLFGGAFASPLLVLRDSALEHNMRQMDDYVAAHGVTLVPHGKTAMAPQLVARQIRRGAWGVAAANVSQASVFHRFGIPRILIANEVVDAAGIDWLARHIDDPATQVICYVDSPAGVKLLDEGLRGADGLLDVLVEVATPGGRAGCRDVGSAVATAAAVTRTERLRLLGVSGFEGIMVPDREPDSIETVRGLMRHVRSATTAIAEAGHFARTREVLVTAGGSIFFPEAVDELARDWDIGRPVRFALRCSCYATHDSGIYTRLSPFGGSLAGTEPQRPALELWAQVLSRPEPGLAILNFGKRDAPFSEGVPIPFRIRDSAGRFREPVGTTVTDLNDQHAYLSVPESDPLAVGDWIGLGISHPCLAMDRWSVLPVIDDNDTVIDLYRTFF